MLKIIDTFSGQTLTFTVKNEIGINSKRSIFFLQNVASTKWMNSDHSFKPLRTSISQIVMAEERSTGIDMKTPINESLTAFYQRSFAYQSMKFRMPAMLSQTIDVLVRKKDEILKNRNEADAEDELRSIISDLGKLKSEVQGNKALRKLTGVAPDIAQYNRALDLQLVKVSTPTYFNANWLFAECYLFRRIREVIEQSKFLKDIDPFQYQKEDSFHRTVQMMTQMGGILLEMLSVEEEEKESAFTRLLKLNLWGNKCDLSLNIGRSKFETGEVLDVEKLNENILCDESLNVYDALNDTTESKLVDIVLDNSGYELFTDMCLADFIIKNKFAEQVRFYVKGIPWFISDVTAKDFQWTLHQLKVNRNSTLKRLGERWANYMRIKAWTVEEDNFWTLPLSYKYMDTWDIDLYKKLSAAKLVIFKGDVNYRKLFGEKNWPPTMSVATALQGFHPTKLCTLRTIKAHIVCGLAPGVEEEAEGKDIDWLLSGNFGLIQFCDIIEKK